MNVLFFLQCLGVGGVERQVSMLADYLRGCGDDVSVCGVHVLDSNWTRLWDNSAAAPTVMCEGRPRNAVVAAMQFFSTVLRLRRRLKKESVDVVYATQGYVSFLITWMAVRGLRKTGLVWCVRGAPSVAPWEVRFLRQLSCRIAHTVPMIIAVSQPVDLCPTSHRRSVDNQTIIHDGVDLETFRPDPASGARLRREWGVPGDHALIGVVGRLDPIKDHESFLSAAAILARKQDGVSFVCVGTGPGGVRRALQLRGRSLGLEDRVIWTGSRFDMPAVYNALDVLCSPSLHEGFNLAIGEAMASGTPCVVTTTADPVGMAGPHGITVPPRKPEALAEGLETMLDRARSLDRDEIRSRISRYYGSKRMLRATEAALRGVAGPNG